MRHNARPLFCIAAATLVSGCITRTVEIRPVAPVVESRSAPVTTRAAASAAPQSSLQFSGDSGVTRQATSRGIDESGNPSGVRVEAVIPGVYSGRSLSFEKADSPESAVPAEP